MSLALSVKSALCVVGFIGESSSVCRRFQHASDTVYDKYRCPVFKGFVICVCVSLVLSVKTALCVTGFSMHLTQHMKNSVVQYLKVSSFVSLE